MLFCCRELSKKDRMKTTLLNLNRTLFEVSGADWSDSDVDMARAFKQLLPWSDVLKNKCSVLVGSANSGKTSEFRLQAAALRKAKTHACFVAVRELLSVGAIEDALERDEVLALRAWLKVPGQQLYLFVDSIDEAALSGPRDLRTCLRKLVDTVAIATENVTWVLSTRPAVLNLDVLNAIDDALGVTISQQQTTTIQRSGIDDAAESKAVSEPSLQNAVHTAKVFRLAPLTGPQARTFLESALGLSNAASVMEAAEYHGLGHLLLSPGKCKLLAQMDLIDTPPVSLEQTYRRSVALHLDASSHGRTRAIKASKGQLETEASRLAAASTLCERLNIELPSESDEPSPKALSARTIIRGLLDAELQYLLSTDFFEESGHQQVKIQPDDVRFYLTARRLSELIHGREDARKVAQILGWRAPTGELGIFSLFIPVAGWLATLNRYFRLECLELAPQCVALFGDLRSLPVPEAQAAITIAIRQIASGQRIWRSAYHLTSENFWQAGGPLLLPHIAVLFKENIDHEDVRVLLLDIVRTVRSPVLLDQAFAWAGKSYQRILEDLTLLTYFLEVGNLKDRTRLRSAALKASNLSEFNLGTLIKHCAWSTLDAADIAALVRRTIDDDECKYTLSYYLTHEVGPTASTGDLQDLTKCLLDLVIASLPANDEDYIREGLGWLAEVVSELLAELAQRPVKGAAIKSVASLVVEFSTKVLDRDLASKIDFNKLQETLQPPSLLRVEVVRQLLRKYKSADESMLWRTFMLRQPVVRPTLEEASAAKAKVIMKVLAESAAALERGRRQAIPVTSKRTIPANDKNLDELRKRKAAIKDGTDINALSWAAQLLSSTGGLSRYGDAALGAFKVAYGPELADAVSMGLKALWRAQRPRRDEANPRSTYWSTIAGLQGLYLEFTGIAKLSLTKKEVQRALDYGLYELNGVPKWYLAVISSNTADSVKFFRRTLKSAHLGAVSAERAAKILTLLRDSPPEVQNALAADAWATVCADKLDYYQTYNVLSFLVEKGHVSADVFVREARQHVFVDPSTATTAIWAVNWLLLDAPAFLEGLANARCETNQSYDSLISDIATAVEDGRGPSFQELSKHNSTAIDAMKALYLELVRILPREDDKEHPPGKVYNVDDRERAQRTRDRLPRVLASVHTTAGYLALKEVRDLASTESERHYFQTLMYEAAEAMQRRPRPMTEDEYIEFESTLRSPPGTLEAFAHHVENDILDVKDIVENGEFSPRRFLATSVQDVQSGVVKAMEAEFQLYLAGQMDVLGRKHYSVFREPQGSDDSRRDISIALPAQNWKTTLELKVTNGGWTLSDYRESLRNQLVGLYMRERRTTVGFFVILRQSRQRWEGPDGLLEYEDLLKQLQEDALLIEAEQPNLRLRVIGIDATEPLKADGTLVRASAEPKAIKEAKRAVRKARQTEFADSTRRAIKG
jgi:hypothetical protein